MKKSIFKRHLFFGVFGFFAIILFLALIFSKDFNQSPTLWDFSNLRTFDPLDSPFARSELIAAYTRRIEGFIEFRFDVLDLLTEDSSEIQLLAMNKFDQILWTLHWSNDSIPIVKMTAEKTPIEARIPSVIKDPVMDYFIVRLNSDLITQYQGPLSFKLQVLDQNTGEILDEIPYFKESDREERSSYVLLEFWNTLPSQTPSQILRSWDGAHSGPFGQRHGLKYLIDNAEKYQIPIVLLDVKSTYPLLALDMLSALDRIRILEKKSIVFLPFSSFDDQTNLSTHRKNTINTAKIYGLSTKNLIFSHFASTNPFISELYFSQLSDNSHVYQVENNRHIPLPTTFPYPSNTFPTPIEIARSVLTENEKNNLINVALSPDRRDIFVIGDDLQYSPWADAQLSPILFRYINEHPWIKALNGNDLWNHAAISTKKDDLPVLCEGVLICNRFVSTTSYFPVDDSSLDLFIMELINQASNYYTFESPNYRPEFDRNFTYLHFAEHWFSEPYNQIACEVDFGDELHPGCVIANENGIILINPVNGDILLAIARKNHHLLVMIIPPSQIMNQENQPPTYSALIATDLINQNESSASMDYDYEFITNGILFRSANGEISKRYFMDSSCLHIEIFAETATNSVFPGLALSDLLKVSEVTANALPWREIHEIQPKFLFTDGVMKRISFADSHDTLLNGESPNYDYPAGHYLPIPFQLLEISGFHQLNMEFVFAADEN